MKRNFLTLFILVLVIAFATCFMITGCKKPEPEPTQSSIDNGRKSVPQSVEEPDDSETSTPNTPTSQEPTNSSDDPDTSSTDDPNTSSSNDPGSSDEPTSSSQEEVRPSDTPIYNSGN